MAQQNKRTKAESQVAEAEEQTTEIQTQEQEEQTDTEAAKNKDGLIPGQAVDFATIQRIEKNRQNASN